MLVICFDVEFIWSRFEAIHLFWEAEYSAGEPSQRDSWVCGRAGSRT